MSKKTEVKRRAKYIDTKSPDYKSFYVTGVFGGIGPVDARMLFYLDRIVPETNSEEFRGSMRVEHIERELQVELHVSPFEFKLLSKWMTDHLLDYETRYGEIPEPQTKSIKESEIPDK